MKKQRIFAVILLAFYLGTYNGRLALWQDGNVEPIRIYPYSSAVYTKIDQNLLQNGIKIHDIRTLEKLLDDYLS